MKGLVSLLLCLSLGILIVALAIKPSHALPTIAKTDRNGSVNMSEAEEEEVAAGEDTNEGVASADDEDSMEDAPDDDGEEIGVDDAGDDDAGGGDDDIGDDGGGDDRGDDDGD
jgi:hypothetical protein